jgi:hypothetical protein
MSPETKQLLGVLLALSPWIAFAVAVAWCFAQELRERLRAVPMRSDEPRRREEHRGPQARRVA